MSAIDQTSLLLEDERDLASNNDRLAPAGTFRDVPAFALDVPETIPQLGYGSHQFFRYYGKFPSVVGREIVARHARSGQPVLDCYAGSGTTLVEAQNAGLTSFGIDINPLAVLACQVKTHYPSADVIRTALDRVLSSLMPTVVPTMKSMSQQRLDKWFSPEVQDELAAIRARLLAEPIGPTRSFLALAFLGVVRRVSTAYDGEVRPHVNPEKKARSATLAFDKKAREMIGALDEINALRPVDVPSKSLIADNRQADSYATLLGDQRAGLIVAHPPYLNSFNYLSVFGLELGWAEGFPEIWGDWDVPSIRQKEQVAWPATKDGLVSQYYDDFRATIEAAVTVAQPGARVAVVIGDATIRGALEQVHQQYWDVLTSLGLSPVEIWFRTTHYGIGKYAYSHRADYHGEAEKRDAVLFFECP